MSLDSDKIFQNILRRRKEYDLKYSLRIDKSDKDNKPSVGFSDFVTKEAGILSGSDIFPGTIELYEQGHSRGLKTGWPRLEEKFSIQPNELTIITGYPSSGKSTFLNNLLVNLAQDNNFSTCFFTPESYPYRNHQSVLMQMFYKKAFFGSGRMSLDELKGKEYFLDTFFSWIDLDNFDELTLECLIDKFALAKVEKQINAIVIDPWNEIEHVFTRGENETQYVSKWLSLLKQFAIRMDVHVFIVHHPRKIQNFTKKLKVPSPDDLAGSYSWWAKADNCITVYRTDEYETPVEIHIKKVKREGDTGYPGKVLLNFDEQTKTYSDISPFDEGYKPF